VHDEAAARELRRRLNGRVEVLSGPQGVVEAAGRPEGQVIVSAIVGSAGLRPTFEAVRRGKRVALANKETLVVGGELITAEMKRSGATLLPVDSEHSAIFQCLEGRPAASVHRIILTASGGPFRTRKNLSRVTVREALRHPTWRMGRKITIDSATLMNKGLEIIEARWLFDLPVDRIDVMIHPQSIVHSLVEFVDGSVLAQLGLPDMELPIQYALTHPRRAALPRPRLDLARVGALTFAPPDTRRFPAMALACDAARAGGTAPVVLNAANEVAVEAFLAGRIGFTDIPRIIGRALKALPARRLEGLEDVVASDREARAVAGGVVEAIA
jgi:1-deoxy-D-xylulose-5-phosphate reductoisomerase